MIISIAASLYVMHAVLRMLSFDKPGLITYLQDGFRDLLCIAKILCLRQLPATEGLLHETADAPSIHRPRWALLHRLQSS